jgi:hypothetical protein
VTCAFYLLEQFTDIVVIKTKLCSHPTRTHFKRFGGCEFASDKKASPQEIIDGLFEVIGAAAAHLSLELFRDIII